MRKDGGGNWNRAGRKSGGSRPFVIGIAGRKVPVNADLFPPILDNGNLPTYPHVVWIQRADGSWELKSSWPTLGEAMECVRRLEAGPERFTAKFGTVADSTFKSR